MAMPAVAASPEYLATLSPERAAAPLATNPE